MHVIARDGPVKMGLSTTLQTASFITATREGIDDGSGQGRNHEETGLHSNANSTAVSKVSVYGNQAG
jgi:hypothetical protein